MVTLKSSIDVAYHMNHKNGEIGDYKFKATDAHGGKFVCKNPYPCDFDKGIIEAMANKFKPSDSLAVLVEHDPKCDCRKTGGDSCTYNVSW